MQTTMTPATAGHIRHNPARHLDQNSHILRSLTAVQRVFDWLEVEGFTVLDIQAGGNHARPVITIETCGKCAFLKSSHGAYANMYHSVDGIRTTRWRADIMGVRVKWHERGH